MDEPSLRSLIRFLEQYLSSLESWLYFWTWLVVIGCACELLFVIHAYRDDRKVWYRARTCGLISLPEKPSFFVLILEVLSVALVVVGISGELSIDRKSGSIQTQLRSANASLILLLEQGAGEAKASADEAARASGKAVVSADTAGKKAGKVEQTVDLIGKQASALEKQGQ